MESSDEEDEGEDIEVGGTTTKTKHDLMLKTEVGRMKLKGGPRVLTLRDIPLLWNKKRNQEKFWKFDAQEKKRSAKFKHFRTISCRGS